MNATAKNYDSVKPVERARVERRSRRARRYRAMFFLPGAAAVLALVLLAYNDVRWRDQLVEQKERDGQRIAKLEAELAFRKQGGWRQVCRDWPVHMERWRVENCNRTVYRM